jgi:hypothetical protein
MFKQAYPIFLNTQSADKIISSDGLFEWILDRSILPVNKAISDMEIQVHSLQISRQFSNVMNGGNVLTFMLTSGLAPNEVTEQYTIVIDELYNATIDEIIAKFNAVVSANRVGVPLAVARPLTLVRGSRTDRIISIFTPSSSKIVIENSGLALRLGISNESLNVLGTNNTIAAAVAMRGTFDLNFPKMLYITTDSLDIDISADSTPTASKKVLCGLAVNAAYGDFIPMEFPFVRLPLANKSINRVQLKLVDELFNPIQMYNSFSITLMLYK